MIYEYGCTPCLKTFEVIKPIAEYDTAENCTLCGTPMIRVFSPPQISIAKMEPHFNHAFGKVIHSKHHLSEHIKRSNGDKGTNIVEVGTDKLSSIKKKRREY